MGDSTPSAVQALLKCRCPRCRKGPVFAHSAISTKFSKTNKKCPHCGLKYEVEPGFFIGAMYVSYAFTVAIVLVVGFAVNILMENPSVNTIMFYVILVTLLLVPFIFRYSRVIYLYLFSGVDFDRRYQ